MKNAILESVVSSTNEVGEKCCRAFVTDEHEPLDDGVMGLSVCGDVRGKQSWRACEVIIEEEEYFTNGFACSTRFGLDLAAMWLVDKSEVSVGLDGAQVIESGVSRTIVDGNDFKVSSG